MCDSFITYYLCVCFSFLQHRPNRDMNVQGAWQQGYTGKGSVVSILDDGIEKNHPDLMKNYVSLRASRLESMSGLT